MRVRRILIGLLVAAFLLWQRKALGELFALVMLSATIAYLVTPLGRLLERHVSEKWGMALAFLLVTLLLAGIVSLLVPNLARQIVALAEQLPAIWTALGEQLAVLEMRLLEGGIPKEALEQFSGQAAQIGLDFLGALRKGTSQAVGSLAKLGWVLLAPMVAYYLARDRERLFNQLERIIPARMRPFALALAGGARDALRQYVRGQVIVSIITGILTAVGLLIAGESTWLLMGLIMAVCNLIPYFGPIIGAVPILVVAAVGGMGQVLKCLIVVVAAQQLESLLITPRIMSGTSNLHPAIVIVGLFLGGVMGGLAGMVFALPTLMILRVIYQHIVDWKLYGYH